VDAHLGEAERPSGHQVEHEDGGLLDIPDVSIEDRPVIHHPSEDGEERLVPHERVVEVDHTDGGNDQQRGHE